MSGHDAFEEEMGFLGRIRDADAERLLSGRAPDAGPDGGLGEVAVFITAIMAMVPAPPDRDAEAFLVPRLAAEARTATDARAAADTGTTGVARAQRRRPRLALATRVAIAVVLVPVAMTGLAFAGVRLPEPARSAFEQAGVELPNQSDGDEVTSDDGAGVDEGQPSQSRGGEDEGADADRGSAGTEPAKRGRRDRRPESDHPRGSPGGGNGGQASPPSGTGPSGVPPGQGGTPPGQGGTPPGQASPPPGQGGTPSGQGGAIPGSGSGGQSALPHGGGPPGGVPPGQAKPK